MLAATGAPADITFESYIYWSSRVGREFTARCRSAPGRSPYARYDRLGGIPKGRPGRRGGYAEGGVEVVMYRPLRWYQLNRLNHRTHRKLLIVDGRIGFTGGMGVADQWLGHAQDPEHWRDSQFQAEGPVVAQLQAAFMDDWFEMRGEVLDGPGYFPDLDPAGSELAQAFRSSPTGGNGNLRLMFLLAIASASRRVLIANSYFVPDQMTVDMLVARRRGEWTIIVPARSSTPRCARASRAMCGPMPRAGVGITITSPPCTHQGVVVDDAWFSSADQFDTARSGSTRGEPQRAGSQIARHRPVCSRGPARSHR